MEFETITLKGKRYVLVAESDFRRIVPDVRGKVSEDELPALPAPDKNGNVPALEYTRISLARELITSRKAARLSQAELARRANVRVETLNRLEKGKHMPDQRTFDKIEAALRKAESRTRTSRRAHRKSA